MGEGVVAARRSWRTWMFLLMTYLGSVRVGHLRSSAFGRAALALGERMFARGAVQVRGGAGYGVLLSTDWLALDHRQGYGLVRGTLEPEVQEALKRHIEPGAVVFDVGANLGFFSMLSALLAGPHGRIFAFEPVPDSAAAVRANAKLNRLSNVEVLEVAVSDKSGRGTLCLPPERSWSHLTDYGRHPDTEAEIDVRLVALDDEVERGALPVPDVVKIDVEGNEAPVLNGMRRTLCAHDITVVCELHASNVAVLEFAAEVGYRVENLEGTGDVAEAGAIHVLLRRRPRCE